MGRVKSQMLKTRLGKANRKSRRGVPLFVVVKTKRRLRLNPHQRSWRTQKLKMKED